MKRFKQYFSLVGILLVFITGSVQNALAQTSDIFIVSTQFGEDTGPPTTPDPVIAAPIASSQIDIVWGASTHPFSVGGYQVFRDSIQIATTTETSFSDIGLIASTTYSYFIRAFSSPGGNVSSSSITVATTTFDLPPPPPVATTTDAQRRQQAGRAPEPKLQTFTLVPGATSVSMEFQTSVPTLYTIRYGQTDAFADGVVQTEVFRWAHDTVLTDLSPGTVYEYELLITDRYNQTVVVRRGSFTTDARFPEVTPPNVTQFHAVVIGSDVLLSWRLPTFSHFSQVRVVRNHRFFPTDPLDGEIVYEGRGVGVIDIGALRDRPRQYYTIFVFDLSGNYSSGAVAIAEPPEESPPLPDLRPPKSVSPPADPTPPSLRFSDIEIIQADDLAQPVADTVSVTRGESFLLRIPYTSVPEHLKIITVSISRPEGTPAIDVYLLRRSSDSGYYQAQIDGLRSFGSHPLLLTVYDVQQNVMYSIRGEIESVITTEPFVLDTEPWYMIFGYWLTGLMILLAGYLIIWRVWIIVWCRRRTEDKQP